MVTLLNVADQLPTNTEQASVYRRSVDILPPRRNSDRRKNAFETLLFASLAGKLTVVLRLAADLVQIGSELRRVGYFIYLPLLAVDARTWSRRIVK